MPTFTAVKRGAIVSALEQANVDTDNIRADYSGRGMYGETCFAITFDTINELGRFLVELTASLAEDTMCDEEPDVYDATETARKLAVRMRTDSMGGGIVAYFPSITLED